MAALDKAKATKAICGDLKYHETSNSCYWRRDKAGSFDEVLNVCKEKEGGTLSFIKSKAELDWIKDSLKIGYGSYWIGLKYHYDKEIFVWLDGDHLTKNDFSMWSREDRRNDKEDCVALKGKSTWTPSKCADRHPGICAIPGVDMCRVKNGGCDHKCITNGRLNRTCICEPGYKSSGTRCLTTCEEENGGCDQICTNFGDSRNCSCKGGFDVDGVRCYRNAQTKTFGAIMAGLIFGSLLACILLLCCVWAFREEDSSMKDKSSDESFSQGSKRSVAKSSIAKSSIKHEDLDFEVDRKASPAVESPPEQSSPVV